MPDPGNDPAVRDFERADDDTGWDAAIVDLLARAHRAQPDELASTINASARPLGVDVTIYLIDHEQERLWALPEVGKPTPPSLPVDGTLAGRAFTSVQSHPGRDQDVTYRLWVPMVDGSERLGVAEVIAHHVPADPAAFAHRCEELIGLVGHLMTVKMPYGDRLQTVRRTRPMTAAGELILQMLPPLTFSCRRMVVSAVLEPCYDVGGDAFDYAVDGAMARIMVLDAMGNGLKAALTSATALASIRAARRVGQDLAGMARAADAAIVEQFPDLRFVTGVLADLDMDTGVLRYVNAGHPAPILIRDGRAVRTLTGGRRMPLGIGDTTIEPAVETLEPGDRLLLYTDGVTEAYGRNGERFGAGRLVDLAEQCMGAGLAAPETLRRLVHTVLAHQGGRPSDDATFLLFEWSHEAAERVKP